MMRNWKRGLLLTALSVMSLCMGAAGVCTFADVPAETPDWTDNLIYDAGCGYGGGSGTAPDPYLLSEPEHLAMLAVNQNQTEGVTENYSTGLYFKLTGDINLSGKNWIPIGNRVGGDERLNLFRGVIDFDGRKITGISHEGYDGQFYGLVGVFSIGSLIHPDVTFGDVNVDFTAGAGSVTDDAVTTSGCYGGIVGLMIGGTVGGYEETSVRVTFAGKTDFRVSAAGRQNRSGGLVGYLISGTVGNAGKTGNTEILAQIGPSGGLSMVNAGTTDAEHLYAGGLVGVGNASDPVVGKRSNENDGDVSIRFVNHNAGSAAGDGLYGSGNYIRMGGLIGFSQFAVGSAGTGGGDVTLEVENAGLIRQVCTSAVTPPQAYLGGMFAEIDGTDAVGTAGTGNVRISLVNLGSILFEKAGRYSRPGGIAGLVNGSAVLGISNPASAGDVTITLLNSPGALISKDEPDTDGSVLVSMVNEGTLVGTKGTGNLFYAIKSEERGLLRGDAFLSNLVCYQFGTIGSLDGGTAVNADKTHGFVLLDTGTETGALPGKTALNYTDKIVETAHASWRIAGVSAAGVTLSVLAEEGFAFLGWNDKSQVVTGADGSPVLLFDGSEALPQPELLELSTVTVDFSRQTYTGEPLSPVAAGYYIQCVGENGQVLTMIRPDTYRIRSVRLYRNDVFLGEKRYVTLKEFVIDRAENPAEVSAGALMIDPNTETYIADSKYEISAEAAFGTVLANSGSLTPYKNGTLYIREKGTSTHYPSRAVALDFPAYRVTLPEGAGYTVSAAEERTSYLSGAYFKFGLTAEEGYDLTGVVVKAGGQTLLPSEGLYSVQISSDLTVEITNVEKIRYPVTLPEVEGCRVVPADTAKTVEHGGSFSFRLEAEKGYDLSGAVVKVNGAVLEAKEGVYTLSEVTAALSVTVEGVGKLPEEKAGCGGTGAASAGLAALAGVLLFAKRKR